MKILYIAPLNSVHSQRWIQYFANEGHHVSVLNFHPQTVDISDAEIITIQPPKSFLLKFLFAISYIFRARSIIKAVNPDIIHIHWIHPFLAYLVLGISCPIIATAWGSDILICTKNPLIRWHIKYFIKHCTLFTCDANHLRDRLIQLGAFESKIRLVYFGTDVEKFNPSKKDPEIRKRFSFEAETKIILSLRSLNPIYNIETLIRAMPEILNKHPETRFIIVGRGSEKEKLITLSKKLNTFKQIRFLEGLSNEDLQTITASVDIYVSTSLSDGGLAASTAEAMACEVPVVISDFGENSQWVEGGEAGLLFPLKDHETLATKLIYLLDNPEITTQIASRGRKKIEQDNNYFYEMKKMIELYKSLNH